MGVGGVFGVCVWGGGYWAFATNYNREKCWLPSTEIVKEKNSTPFQNNIDFI